MIYDVIIIGAGPAGMTAAIYARRSGMSTLLLEKTMQGGQMINAAEIENYPGIVTGGPELATAMFSQLSALGAETVYAEVTQITDGAVKRVLADNKEYEARSVIIANGVTRRPLGIDAEQRYIGRGVSYCATCDGAFYRGRTAAVVGGGNTAFEDALYLAPIVERLYIIHRRDEFRADAADVKRLLAFKNVTPMYSHSVTGLSGEGTLAAIELTDLKTGEKRTVATDALFIAIGQQTANDAFDALIETADGGYIRAGEDCITNRPGIFVAGDTRTKTLRQIVTAVSDGAVAAAAAKKYTDSL